MTAETVGADVAAGLTTHLAEDAEERGEGICRTCLAPIWWEIGTVGGVERGPEWSDRIKRGGDSLVCFKAIDYRHVPLKSREAYIYDEAFKRGQKATSDHAAALRAAHASGYILGYGKGCDATFAAARSEAGA